MMWYGIDNKNDDTRSTNSDGYWPLIRKVAFSFDAEHMHELAIVLLRLRSIFINKDLHERSIARNFAFRNNQMGLSFRNPVGLAAGFDVDGDCLPALQHLGFGFIELGGITEKPQPGNEKPRIFRLPDDQALINRLNFYNKGALRLRRKLFELREQGRIFVPVGVNLGKSNFSPLDEVPAEYLRTFKMVHEVADYVTINISCPNTEGLSRFQTANSLGRLLDTVCNFNENLKNPVPLLLKLGPDLSNEEAVACAEIAIDYKLSGLVISNTTKKRAGLNTGVDYGPGGLSGRPLFERSTQLLRCIAKDYGKKLTLMGCGGIMDGASALAKLNAGADLLQVYTGFVYGGPAFVKRLLHYLLVHHYG